MNKQGKQFWRSVYLIIAFCLIMFGITKACAQDTKISIGTGLLEESNKMGVGTVVNIGVDQNVISNFGTTIIYTHGFPYRGNFDQLRLNGWYDIEIDRSLSIKPNIGVATQFNGNLYPAFGLDLLARASSKTQIVWSWAPVVRGSFNDINSGWSHTVTIGLMYRL